MPDRSRPYISARNVTRHYHRGPAVVKALDGVTFGVDAGELVAVVGASGSGKSTLLNLVAGLDQPTSGRIRVDNVKLDTMTQRQLSAYRADMVGMIFQSFNLLTHRTAQSNVEMALYFTDLARSQRSDQARRVLKRLGMAERLDHLPADLSGGEQQRVAIARALVKGPPILLADEPTGNLDHENSRLIASQLRELNQSGLTIMMVTHDLQLADRLATRVIRMSYGKIEADERTSPERGL